MFHYRGLKKLDPWDVGTYESIVEYYYNPYQGYFECIIPSYSDRPFTVKPDLIGYTDHRINAVLQQYKDRWIIEYDVNFREWCIRREHDGKTQEIMHDQSLEKCYILTGAYTRLWPIVIAAIMMSAGYKGSGLTLKITPAADY